MSKKKTFFQAFTQISEKFSYLELLEFNGNLNKAKFIDKTFGEFDGYFYLVLKGKKSHPERSKINKINKIKQTCFKKYDVSNVSQVKEIKNKVKKTCLERYGKESPLQSKEIQKKIKNTNLENYGTENPQKNKEIRNKTKQTNLNKYGTENVFSSKEIKEKIKKTNLERYGKDSFSKTKDFKDKFQQTCLERYGVKNPSQNESIKHKKNKTSLINYGVDHPLKNKDIVEKIQTTREANGFNIKINGLTYKNIADKYGYAYTTICNYINKGNSIDNLANKKKFASLLEKKVYDFLVQNNINFIYGNSNNVFINKYKPDFIINNLLIECDGLYWHSDIKYDKKYHKKKQETYKELGYKSLFFREDEILNKTNIVESIILAKLGRFNERIFARKTKIIELYSKKASAFFEENHLMGPGSGQCYALTYNEKIVSAIRIIKKKDYIDISRFCSTLHTNVVGGLSKLLKYIIKEHKPQKIQSFVDMRYGDGHSLEKLGFVETTNHISFKWTDFKNTYHRMNFKGNSGYEKGLFKIWDCGQKKFELKL